MSVSASIPTAQDLHRTAGLKLLADVVRTLGWRYVAVIASAFALSATSLLPPELLRRFVATLGQPHAAQGLPQQLLLWGAALAALLSFVALVTLGLREWLRLRIERLLRRRVLRTVHTVRTEALDGLERGDWLMRMSSDLHSVEGFLTESIPEQVRDAAVFCGAAALFLTHFGAIAGLALVGAALLALVNARVQTHMAPILGELRTMNGSAFQSLIEGLEGRKTVRAQKAEAQAEARFERRLAAINTAGFRIVGPLGGLMGLNQAAVQLMTACCLAGIAWAVAAGKLSVNDALVAPFYLGLFFGAAQGLAGGAYAWNRFFAEGARLADLFDLAKRAPEEAQPHLVDLSAAATLELRNVVVGHGAHTATRPLSTRFDRFAIHAIVGPSGGGKSTLLEVLAGLRAPLSGQVRLAAQDDTQMWPPHDGARTAHRSACAFVEQQPYVFAGTVRDNLIFGDAQRTQDCDLHHALKRVGLAARFASQGGLAARIDDRGDNLSAGERYRLSLARALLSRRPFLLLDEPFAALDPRSIDLVIDALSEETATKGVILVTHVLPPALSHCSGLPVFPGFIQPSHEFGVTHA